MAPYKGHAPKIDLQQNNLKLVERSKKIIMLAADVDYDEAARYLEKSKGHVKTAIFLSITDVSPQQAEKYLMENNGYLKKAIKDWRDKK